MKNQKCKSLIGFNYFYIKKNMKNIIILIITIFSINYSFGQMKVYAGTDVYNKKNLVGIIYSSGEVYQYSNVSGKCPSMQERPGTNK